MSSRKQYSQANYSRLEFDDATVERLIDFCLRNRIGIAVGEGGRGINAEDFKFHVTLVYSAVTHSSFRDTSIEIDPIRLLPKQFQIFGFSEPRLVLELELDDALRTLFEYYKETFGLRPDYDPYRPHLTFEGTKGARSESIRALTVPSFPLIACRIVQEVR